MGNTTFFANLSWTRTRASRDRALRARAARSDRTFEIGDPSLGYRDARSRSRAAIRHQDTNDNNASFSIYHTNFTGFIYGLLTGNSYDEDGTFFPDEFRRVQGAALFRSRTRLSGGWKGQIHWHVFEGMNGRFGVDAQADYVRATVRRRGPTCRAFRPSDWRRHFLRERKRSELKLGALYHGEQDKIAVERDADRSYTTLDASATIHLYEGPAATSTWCSAARTSRIPSAATRVVHQGFRGAARPDVPADAARRAVMRNFCNQLIVRNNLHVQ